LMRADSLQDDDTDLQVAITKVIDSEAEASTDYDDTEFGDEAESPIIGAMDLDDDGTPEEREDTAEEIDEAATRTEADSIAEATGGHRRPRGAGGPTVIDLRPVLVPLPVRLPLIGAGIALILSKNTRAQNIVSVGILCAVMVIATLILIGTDANGPQVVAIGG